MTEMVWEDCPEEEEKIIVEKAEPKMRAEAIALKDMSSKKKVGAARANKDEGAKGVQKSMMSFFVKK